MIQQNIFMITLVRKTWKNQNRHFLVIGSSSQNKGSFTIPLFLDFVVSS